MSKSTALLSFLETNRGQFFTVAELATATGISPSRVRELIPGITGLQNQRTGKAFSFSLPAPVVEATPAAKPARKLLNPQPVIAKKSAALREAGGELVYASRTWTVMFGSTVVKTLTSQEFAALSAEELVALLP